MRHDGSTYPRTHGRAVRLTTSQQHAGDAQRAPLALTSTVRTLPTSATLRLNELVAARAAAGQQTIHLGFGEARFPLLPAMRAGLAEGAAATEYPPVQGLPATREAIAAYLGRTRGLEVGAGQVLVGPGSKALIYALLEVLEGDLLLPVPRWVSYAPQARLTGKRIIPVPTAPDDHLGLTPEALSGAWARARHEGADPRILLVNSPSNPTGGMFAEAEVAGLARWAREHGVAVISDELYAELAHGEREHQTPARFYPEGTIAVGGLSKAFSAGGWRLGYAVVPPDAAGQRLLSALRAVASEIWSGATAPVQVAAARVYVGGAEVEAYVRRGARLHGYATRRMHSALTGWDVDCPRPYGGFYLYPDFERWRERLAGRGIATGMDLARHLLEVWGIATLPASEFGERAEALRLRLATSHLFEPDGAPDAAAREAALWALLERADDLPAPGDDAAAAPARLDLPALDRALARLGEFVASLG